MTPVVDADVVKHALAFLNLLHDFHITFDQEDATLTIRFPQFEITLKTIVSVIYDCFPREAYFQEQETRTLQACLEKKWIAFTLRAAFTEALGILFKEGSTIATGAEWCYCLDESGDQKRLPLCKEHTLHTKCYIDWYERQTGKDLCPLGCQHVEVQLDMLSSVLP